MIPVNMILSLEQGPKWQARWDEGKVEGGDVEPPQPVPSRARRWIAVLVAMASPRLAFPNR
jgi:hypothetical protein